MRYPPRNLVIVLALGILLLPPQRRVKARIDTAGQKTWHETQYGRSSLKGKPESLREEARMAIPAATLLVVAPSYPRWCGLWSSLLLICAGDAGDRVSDCVWEPDQVAWPLARLTDEVAVIQTSA